MDKDIISIFSEHAMVLALPFQQVNNAAAGTIIGYSAEDDIGLVPWDSSLPTRTANTNTFNSALDAMYYGGSFTFVDGSTGPVLMPIVFSGKTFYFLPPIKTSTRIGGAIYGTGGSGYEMLSPQFTVGTYGGMKTRLVGLNEVGDTEPVIRIRGNGFQISGLDIYGREMIDWSSNGPRAVACIQMEGHDTHNPGHMTVSHCGLYEAQYGIQTLAGYYDDNGDFQANENHADLSKVEDTNVMNCESVFRSTCQQSIGWTFDNVSIGTVGNYPPAEVVVFDINRGGCITCDNIIINTTKACVIQVDDWSPNQSSFSLNEVYWDRPSVVTTQNYLTLFRYIGSEYSSEQWGWRVRMSGTLGESTIENYDYGRLLDSHYPTVDMSDVLFEMKNLPINEVDNTAAPPYYTWKQHLGHTFCHHQCNEGTGTSLYDKFRKSTTGTISGATWTTDRNSKAGRALSFASSNYVGIPINARNKVYVNMTVFFRILLNSYTNGCVLTRVGASTNGFRTETGSHFHVGTASSKWDLGGSLTTGSWHSVAVSMDGSNNCLCYLDGVQFGTTQSITNGYWLQEDIDLRIGAPSASYGASGSNSSDMKFSDLRIYDRVVSASDILELHQLSY